MWSKERISGIVIFCFCLTYFIVSLEYNAGTFDFPHYGFFPRFLALVGLFFSILLLLSRKANTSSSISIDWVALKRQSFSGLIVLGSIVVYLVCLPYVGFLLCSACLVTILARAMGGRWISSVIVGAITSLSLYWIFWVMMRVPIPLGTIWGR